MNRSIYIGYDPRESEAFAVCRHSINRYSPDIQVNAICLDDMRAAKFYWRPTSKRDGKLWDDISEAPMATEFAVSRFLTPALAKNGWALFMDCDILARDDINELFHHAENYSQDKAVLCVKHHHQPTTELLKMDGQTQTLYARKNWSSVMLFNCEHPSNADLTVNLVNSVPGRDLHRFCWLKDEEIGSLHPRWNFLVGHSDPSIDPILVHFTSGGPWFEGYEHVPYADEWREVRREWLGSQRMAA